jgi:hypothetical protein
VNVRFANCKVRVISELLSPNECVRVSVSEVSEFAVDAFAMFVLSAWFSLHCAYEA